MDLVDMDYVEVLGILNKDHQCIQIYRNILHDYSLYNNQHLVRMDLVYTIQLEHHVFHNLDKDCQLLNRDNSMMDFWMDHKSLPDHMDLDHMGQFA